jgi:hypothetical protein
MKNSYDRLIQTSKFRYSKYTFWKYNYEYILNSSILKVMEYHFLISYFTS